MTKDESDLTDRIWRRVELVSGEVHLVPRSDRYPHNLSAHCRCRPLVGSGVVVHDAWGRLPKIEDD